MSPQRPTIVVGYDGSSSASAALAHAARRAGPRGLVVIVNAYAPPSDWLGFPNYQAVLDEHRGRGQRLLYDLPAEALDGVKYETELIADDPAHALVAIAHARHADEIVIGSRGFGPLRASLGSVSHKVLHLAHCPVLIVPESAAERSEHAAGQAATAAARG